MTKPLIRPTYQKSLDINLDAGFPQSLEIMENLEIIKKIPCMEKSWNLKKPEYSWKNHGIL